MKLESKKTILQTVQCVFREQFLDDTLIITEDTTPNQIEQWDSLAQVNLLSALEERLNIQFTADEMADIDSVGKIIAAIVQRNRISEC